MLFVLLITFVKFMKKKPGAQINQSILDGIGVLQALAGSDRPVGGKDLAELLGLDSTRVNRLLKTLASIGMTQQTNSRKYTPGPGIHVLAAQSLYASGLLRSAIPSLEKLNQFNLTVAMGVLWFDTVSFIYHAKPGMTAAEGIGRIGIRAATTSGIGMALLATAEQDAVVDVYKDKQIPGFDGGLESLLAELAEIRTRGYVKFQSHNQPENSTTRAWTLAVPVGNPANSAIALQGEIPTSQTLELVQALQNARDEITERLNKLKPEDVG